MYYTPNVEDIESSRAAPQAPRLGSDHPAAYRPDAGLVDAVNTALLLNRPLLLTGEPGTGKTQLAYSVAWQLASRGALHIASGEVERFETKSTSLARDLFYTFDTLGRFQAANTSGSTENADYLTYGALGRALLEALRPEEVRAYLPKSYDHRGPKRSIVLIDEIDKAPRDFPNDLLNEIDQMYFRLPELGNVTIGGPGTFPDELKPLVFITSNSERTLPDPFLRRCIYYNIPFPDETRLNDILLARLSHLGAKSGGPLLEGALKFFLRLRGVTKRRISPAELIQWMTFMLSRGARPDRPLAEARDHALAGLSALTKDPTDQDGVRAELMTVLG